MAGKPYKFKLPIKNGGSPPIISVVQNDTNEFTIQLIDNGRPYNISKATLVTYTALKPDGTVVKDKTATILSALDGTILFIPDLQCVAVVGTIEMTVEVYEGAARATSAIFIMEVTRDLSAGADPSSEQSLPVLEGLITEVTALEESIKNAEMARVAEFNTKITEASTAANLANTKAGLANQAATAANTAATNANTKAALAEEKIIALETEVNKAIQAAALIAEKADSADTAAALANEKAALANTAAQNANTKAAYAESAGNMALEKAALAQQTNAAIQLSENERLARETLATDNAVLATERANTAANAANTAANAANTAANAANTAALLAQETNADIEEVERLRVIAEQARVDAEGDATKGRVKAELDRVTAEQGRVTAEHGRVTAEQDRITEENIRISNETARINAENIRQSYFEEYLVLESYDNSKNYKPGNKVTYEGSTYQNIKQCTGISPKGNKVYWVQISQKGDKGENGRDGFVTTVDNQYGLYINETGHLILKYGITAPNFSINEDGYLILTY